MVPKSPKNSVETKKIVKKRWNPMLKQLAVEKALEIVKDYYEIVKEFAKSNEE